MEEYSFPLNNPSIAIYTYIALRGLVAVSYYGPRPKFLVQPEYIDGLLAPMN